MRYSYIHLFKILLVPVGQIQPPLLSPIDPDMLELHVAHEFPLKIKLLGHMQAPLSFPIDPGMLESHGTHSSPLLTKSLEHMQDPLPSYSEFESIYEHNLQSPVLSLKCYYSQTQACSPLGLELGSISEHSLQRLLSLGSGM